MVGKFKMKFQNEGPRLSNKAQCKPGFTHTLIHLAKMEEELECIVNRRIDLITRQAIEESRNYIRRKTILSSMEKVYGS